MSSEGHSEEASHNSSADDGPPPKMCRHNQCAKVLTSWSTKNPGRRFYRCANWKVDDCGFFEWIDGPQSISARETMNVLVGKRQKLKDDVLRLEEEKRKLEEEKQKLEVQLARAEEKSMKRKLKIKDLKAKLASCGGGSKNITDAIKFVPLVILCVGVASVLVILLKSIG